MLAFSAVFSFGASSLSSVLNQMCKERDRTDGAVKRDTGDRSGGLKKKARERKMVES